MNVTRSSENFNKINVKGTLLAEDGKVLVNDDGTNAADLANAQMYIFQGDTGNSSSSGIGVAAEAAATGSGTSGIGGYFTGKADTADSGFGVIGKGLVSATGDTGSAIAASFVSTDTHAGGDNIGVQSVVSGGANNYSYIGTGDIKIDGRTLGYKGAAVASANDITLGQGNFFVITGTTQINRILGTGWTPGSVVTFRFNLSVDVTHNTAAGSDYYGFLLAGGSTFSATGEDTLTVLFDGGYWREISRTVI